MSAVRLFFGAVFILSEFTDIYFEVKAVLCLDFYAFRDIFRRNDIVLQNYIGGNCFMLERNVSKSKNTFYPFAVANACGKEYIMLL